MRYSDSDSEEKPNIEEPRESVEVKMEKCDIKIPVFDGEEYDTWK